MRFHFPLQKIVDLKKNEKTQAEWVLSSAFGKLKAEEISLEALLKEQTKQQQRLASASEAPVPIADIQFIQQYITYLQQAIDKQRGLVKAAQLHVEGSKQALTEKTLDEKVWNKAREKALEHFNAASLKKEQHELDELASVRFSVQS